MVWVSDDRSVSTIQSMIEQIVSTGELSRQEHVELISVILADYQLTDEDRRHIGRVLDYVQIGRLKLID